jgi:hypothetical protein
MKRRTWTIALPDSYPTKSRFDYQPEPKIKGHGLRQPNKNVLGSPAKAKPDLFRDKANIDSSFAALADRFALDQIIMATEDGLVFASSGGTDPASDAATYTEIVTHDPLFETPGVTIFRLEHKGSALIGIIKTKKMMSEDTKREITTDTKAILEWWV